jgi:hypothetical protein
MRILEAEPAYDATIHSPGTVFRPSSIGRHQRMSRTGTDLHGPVDRVRRGLPGIGLRSQESWFRAEITSTKNVPAVPCFCSISAGAQNEVICTRPNVLAEWVTAETAYLCRGRAGTALGFPRACARACCGATGPRDQVEHGN